MEQNQISPLRNGEGQGEGSNLPLRKGAHRGPGESALMIDLCRPRRDGAARERIGEMLAAGAGWDGFFALARRHGVAAIAGKALLDDFPADAPRECRDLARQAVQGAALRGLRQMQALLGLLEKLRAGGVAAVPFKGPALSLQAYGDPGLRHFVDLDIMVRPADAAPARELLRQAGYAPHSDIEPRQWENYLRVRKDLGFTNEPGGVLVDLNWSLAESYYAFKPQMAGWFLRAQQTDFSGKKFCAFSPEDTLLLLCQHGSVHYWQRLLWICDVAYLLHAHPVLDWDAATGRARECGGLRMLLLGLGLAQELLGASIPQNVAGMIGGDKAAARLARSISQAYVNGSPREPGRLRKNALRLALRERRRDRWGIIAQTAAALAGCEWKILNLPKSFFPAYVVLHRVGFLRDLWKGTFPLNTKTPRR